jgi:simple sugar transport system ATP-binding protein
VTSIESPVAAADPPVVAVAGLTKRFGPLVANDGIDLSIEAGEVHALLGENGAGKSTLTRILYGLSQPDAGEIRIDGRAVRFGSPKDAMRAGIGLVTQEFSLVGTMTVTENVVLATCGLGVVDRRAARANVLDTAARLGVTVDPDAPVASLSVGERQRVEILKALHHGCRLLVLDEPTAVLVPQDVQALFATIRRLTADGMAVVFISHKLHEVVAIADRVTVLRRGRHVTTQRAAGLDPARIAALMVGAELARMPEAAELTGLPQATERLGMQPASPTSDGAGETSAAPAPPVLEVRSLSLEREGVRVLDDVSITVAPGEIVGVAGVSGNGQTELVAVLSAMIAPTSGTIAVGGSDVTASGPLGRIRAGLGRISEDRRGCIVPSLTVEQNLVLEDLDRFRRCGFTQRRLVREHARRLVERFDIRAGLTDPIRSLSGGNVQKVLIARALSRDPRALVVAQPTRGLDVGAAAYVHDQLRSVRDRGGGVLLVSEDLDELFALADRLVVLFAGRVIGELATADVTAETVGLLMTGHERRVASPCS